MDRIGSLIIALAMYSAIPVPHITWNETRLKYIMGFFPVIGIVVGGSIIGLNFLAERLAFSETAFACLAAVLPMLLTGGIHMDGFLDTVDARSSHLEKERRLEILKDPHVGAFAIIGGGIYLLLAVAGFSEMGSREVIVYAGVFVLSRALSGFTLLSWKKARKDGLASSFSASAEVRGVKVMLLMWMVAGGLWIVFFGGLQTAVFSGLAAVAVCAWYHHLAMREFGGITGDLAGYFLQLFELALLWAVVITGGIQ